jgi:hypothetical protein
MFGLGDIFKKLGGSFLQKIATKALMDIPIFKKIATTALKIFDSLPLTKLRNFIKDKTGIDITDFLKGTPLAMVATIMDARDMLASAVGKNGAPQRGTPEFSKWFNGARVIAFDEASKKLAA